MPGKKDLLKEVIRNANRASKEEPRSFFKRKTSTAEVHTVVPISKPSMNIQIKVLEPKPFDGEKQDAKYWLK